MRENIKDKIRREIWSLLLERGAVRRDPFWRIPDFLGKEEAARRASSLDIFREAEVVLINPDSAQRPLRELALRDGKIVYMPTPRLRRGFLRLDPSEIDPRRFREASTIRGAFRYGKILMPWEIEDEIDLVVEGSVAVSPDGSRLGKGGGYGDLEYAIVRELGFDPPVLTTVHDLQIVEKIPRERHDAPVDLIATPTKVLRCNPRERPEGIIWELAKSKMSEIPWLKEFGKRIGKI